MTKVRQEDKDFILAAVGFDLRGWLPEADRSARAPDLVVWAADSGGGFGRAAGLALAYGCPALVWGADFPRFQTHRGQQVTPVGHVPAEFGRVALDEPEGHVKLSVSSSPSEPAAGGFRVYVGDRMPDWMPDAWLRPRGCLAPFPRFYVCSP